MEYENVMIALLILICITTGLAGYYIFKKLREISDKLQTMIFLNQDGIEKLTMMNLKLKGIEKDE